MIVPCYIKTNTLNLRYTKMFLFQIVILMRAFLILFQLVMYVFRLGVVSNLLSETLVNGFTCASAFHVVSSQLKDLLGLPTKKRRGLFRFGHVSRTFYRSIRSTIAISLIVADFVRCSPSSTTSQ